MKDRLDRERALDRLLPDVLRDDSTPSSCVDAEALSAWASGHLRANEAARVEAHLADCAHCQDVLGTFVRSAPPVSSEGLWSRWHLRWLAPLATAAAAVTLYLLVPGLDTRPVPEQVVGLEDPRRQTSPVAPEADTARPPDASAAPPPMLRAAPASPAPPAAAPPPPVRLEDERAGERALEAVRLRESQNRAAARPEAGLVTPAESPAGTSAAKPAAPPPTRGTTVAAPRQEVAMAAPPARPTPTPAPAAPPPASIDATVQAKSAPGVAVGGAAVAERRADAALSLRRQAGVSIDIPTPVPTHRYRIVDGQRVERTTTGGERWQSVVRPIGGEMTAGAAPAADVCWIVGAQGAVWRTTDGEILVRVPFPQSLDLVAVAADSAVIAVVTAADGRAFRTTDGGQTWAPR